MSERDRQVENFGTRLSEIDRKLREIQAELGATEDGSRTGADPARTPGPGPDAPGSPFPSGGRSGPLEGVLLRAPRTAPPSAEDTLARRIGELAELQADLLESLRDVLSAFERAVCQVAAPPPPAPPPAPAAPPPPAPAPASAEELTVSAGPFRTLEEVRSFERELAGLPGVSAAAVRGYEGADRAVIDVQLER